MPSPARPAPIDAAEAFLKTGPWTAASAEAHLEAVRECAGNPQTRRRALLALGRLSGLLRQGEAANEYFRVASEEFPGDPEIRRYYGRLKIRGTQEPEEQAPSTHSTSTEASPIHASRIEAPPIPADTTKAPPIYSATTEAPPQHPTTNKRTVSVNSVEAKPEPDKDDRFTNFIAADSERFAKHILPLLSDLPKGLIKPRVSAYLGRCKIPTLHLHISDVFTIIKTVVLSCASVAFIIAVGAFAPVPEARQAFESALPTIVMAVMAALMFAWPVFLMLVLLRALYIVVLASRTSVEIVAGKIRVETGVFTREVRNIEVTKLRDITLEQSFINQLTGDGALICLADGLDSERGKGDRIELVGLVGGYGKLRLLQDKLRDLKFMMRSANYEKGIIQ